MSREFDDETLDALEVIIPNLNWRYSGGTAVNRTIAPLIAKRWRAAWCGPDRPEGIAALSLGDLLRLRFRPPAHGKVRIWHARRNVEMLAGLFLNLFGYGFALIFNSASQRKKTWLTDFLIDRMDAVIATSEIAAQFLRRPATVILHGIDVDLYSPPADRLAIFAKTGLPGKYGIGTFGRVRKQKGSDLFVEAMCRLLPKYPDFSAVVIGLTTVDNLPFVEGLKQQIAAAGLSERIRFLGELPIDEVPLWYQKISIYVFASRVEGFGLTMLEAMAAGDAVVATRAGAAEMIITDGDDGVLAPVDDVAGARRRARAAHARSRTHRDDGRACARSGCQRVQPRPRGRRDQRRLPAGLGGAEKLEQPGRCAHREGERAGSVENEAAKADQDERQEHVPVAAQRLAQCGMPDEPQRGEAPNEREHGEDRERRDDVPRSLGREDRRIGGDVVASVHDRDGRDLENPDRCRLRFLLGLPEAQQLSHSDDDGREAEQANTLGRDRQGRRCGRQADRDDHRHPEDLASEDMDAREASVGEETDQKEQVVDIRRYEGAGRQQRKREKIHAAAGLL